MPIGVFASALETSAARAFAGKRPADRDVERYLSGLHLEDLALACGCGMGNDAAWEHFILQHRPVLYRAADAIDPTGGARELADSLYADLFGLPNREGDRKSLFRYFHGRSSLATWLRAIVAQRHVDRIRVERRFGEMPDRDPPSPSAPPDPDCSRYRPLMHRALTDAVARLPDRDRLRLAFYYGQDLPLAKTGKLLGESEATSSRHLARTRRALREAVERWLAADGGLTDDQVARAFECAVEDPGTFDLGHIFGAMDERKEIGADRST